MKLKNKLFGRYGLRARFAISLIVAGVIAALTFSILSYVIDLIVNNYFVKSDFEQTHLERQVESLQEYINDNEINRNSLGKLEAWEKKQPLMLLELYDDTDLIYSSYYHNRSRYVNYVGSNSVLFEGNNAFTIVIGETPITAIIYSNFAYRFYVFDLTVSFLAAMIVFVLLFSKSISSLIRYICILENDVQILEGGNLDYAVAVQGNDELTDLAKSVDRMRISFKEQLQTEQELHQSHARLVTEMSHDLRTPLTGLILYSEILKFHRYENAEELQTYLDKIDAKAHHLKQLTDHLFEYTLDGKTPNLQELSGMQGALELPVNDMIGELRENGFLVEKCLEWKPGYIQYKKDYIERILENIVSNINKYAQKDIPIQIGTLYSGKYAGLVVTNTIASVPNRMESTGIGIESIKSMMKQMGGLCLVEQAESVFEITVLFQKQ